MQDHIRDLLSRFQYSEQFRETDVFRILFGGEEVSQVMADSGIHSGYTLRSWVQLYRQKMETGLLSLPAMKPAQKRDMAAFKQRNEELEQTLQQATSNRLRSTGIPRFTNDQSLFGNKASLGNSIRFI